MSYAQQQGAACWLGTMSGSGFVFVRGSCSGRRLGRKAECLDRSPAWNAVAALAPSRCCEAYDVREGLAAGSVESVALIGLWSGSRPHPDSACPQSTCKST